MDEDSFELTKRRLIDEVRESVQKQLFRTYAIVGTAVIAVLGYANWDFIAETKKNVQQKAEEAVEMEIDKVREQVRTLEKNVDQQTGRIQSERDRAREIHAEVATQLSRLDVEAHDLATLNEAVRALTEARRQLEEDIVDVKARTDRLSVLADELKRVAGELKRIDPANAASYQSVVDNVTKAENEVQALTERATVYLQFAGGSRDRAVELSRRLADSGFIVPGEERHGGAAGKREVRYFYEEDKEAADALAAATLAALVAMDYPDRPDVRAIDLTGYKATKPKRGVLELWVEL